MLVYSHSITPRLQYVISFLTEYYGIPFKVTSNEQSYITAKNPCKLNYSYHQVAEDELWIHPHPLLSESAIRPVKVETFKFAGHKAFFKTEGDFPFDVFAALFFLLTRYEEYLPHKKDSFGRYGHENSVAYKEEFLNVPLINIWLEEFRKLIASRDTEFQTVNNQFKFEPTYDIDIAWSYKNKGFKRNAGGILQCFFKGKWRTMAKRIRVLTNKIPDPYDCYEWLNNLHQQYNLHPVFFFLVADKNGRLDKNISIRNENYQALIQEIAEHSAIGLHPSGQRGDVHFLLKKEKQVLETVSHKTITASRQHYIRLTLPATYRRLADAGITDDYSMGYGSINGFRASFAGSFFWYDLPNEQVTKLRIHPFCFMDANSYHEQNFTAEQGLEELMHYYNIVKSVNGTLSTIWHNNFLGTDPQFEGWREAYEQFITTVCSTSNTVTADL